MFSSGVVVFNYTLRGGKHNFVLFSSFFKTGFQRPLISPYYTVCPNEPLDSNINEMNAVMWFTTPVALQGKSK